jgi:hypothetical protein
MNNSKADSESGRVLINTAIIKSLNLTVEDVQNCLVELSHIVGNKTRLLIPNQINDLQTLQSVIWHAKSFGKLKKLNGFNKHLAHYTGKQINSSDFVTVVAEDLVEKKVNNIVFEPELTMTGKKPDLLVEYLGEQVFLEFKTIETKHFNFTEEHQKY